MTKVEQLEAEDPESFAAFLHVAQNFASQLCQMNPEIRRNGLEGTTEIIMGLIEQGELEMTYDGNLFYLGVKKA